MSEPRFKAIVIGISTGGIGTLKPLLGALPAEFPLPLIIVQHLSRDTGDKLALLLDGLCAIHVKEADEEEFPVAGSVYLAPPNYHLLIEPDGSFSFSTDAAVNFSRPSVDVLFETAAEAFGSGVIGVVLTGAGFDGSQGLKRIKERGGIAVVQDPQDATASSMPKHAIMAVEPDYIVTLAALPQLFIRLSESEEP
jgi:two-component system, chemotaxis family, protein-glutamate methylesterase/glutaminase